MHWSCLVPPFSLQANEILHHKLTLNGYLAEFTGQGMETITADTDRDFFMSAQEAVSGGPASPWCMHAARLGSFLCKIAPAPNTAAASLSQVEYGLIDAVVSKPALMMA